MDPAAAPPAPEAPGPDAPGPADASPAAASSPPPAAAAAAAASEAPPDRPFHHALIWGAVVAAFAGLCYALSLGALSSEGSPRQFATVGLVGAVALVPFTAFAFYAAFRWVGLHPTPFLSGAARRGLVPHAARMPLAALAVAFVSVLGSGPLALLLLPEVQTPEEHPFSGKSPLQLAVGNLLIVVEEVVFRLVVFFPLLALFGARHLHREPGARAVGWRVWAAILVSGALFGLVHAPDAAVIGAPIAQYALFALVQKGLFIGTMLGWLCWRYGLEAAVLGHYLTNAIILVLSSFAPQ